MNQRKEAFREAEREYEAHTTLESGLNLAKVMSRKGAPEETYRFLDKLYLEYGDALKEALTQPKLPETFSRYHADITEVVEFEGINLGGRPAFFRIVRREAQGLEAITERIRRRPTITSENGHIHSLEVSLTALDRFPEELYQLPHLRRLTLHNNQLTTPQGLPNLPQLKALHLGHNQLTTLQHLPKLPKLQQIWLDGNQLTTLQGLPNLQQLPKLQQIWFRGNQTPQQEIEELRERGVEVIY